MKTTTVSATLVWAILASVQAAPANGNSQGSTALSTRDLENVHELVAMLNAHTTKRALISDPVELHAREYGIVTQILAAINDTDLAPQIIEGLIDNTTLQPIVTSAAVAIIKSGLVSLDTLFTALNDSGLASTVITDLINDCTFYQDIFKLAKTEISNLVGLIEDKLDGQDVSVKRNDDEDRVLPKLLELSKRYNADGVVNNLLESLAASGLASSVVKALIVDPQFLKYGASLLETLFKDDLINFLSLISALEDSGLVTSLFQQFFTVSTLKTVIFNALAAAFDNCGGSTITGSPTGLVTQTTVTTSLPSFTATQTASITGTANVCKKKRKRRSYNY